MLLCTRCRRAEALVGKRSCRACHDYNVRRSRYLSMSSAVSEQQSLYAMRTLAGHLKGRRSNDVHKRSKQLSADVTRVWPGLGRLEPTAHRHLEDFQVSREVFACPLEAVELVVDHVRAVDVYIKEANERLNHELERWRSGSNGNAAPEPARAIIAASSWGATVCSASSASTACTGCSSGGTCTCSSSEEDACEA